MTTFFASNVENLKTLRQSKSKFSEITLNVDRLKEQGLLRHAFKYASWAIKPGGVLLVESTPSKTGIFSTKEIDFWQVRKEFFKSVSGNFQILNVNDHTGTILAKKVADDSSPTGVTFGIVYGGGERDSNLLKDAIASIGRQQYDPRFSVEILICGNVHEDLAKDLIRLANNIELRIIPYDKTFEANRIPIADKKNRVFEGAKYSIVVISHTRIEFVENFLDHLSQSCFDVVAPSVVVNIDGKERRFLDYISIGSYDTARVSPRQTLAACTTIDDHLLLAKKRVAYVDGGIMIFNKKNISHAPFDPSLAWGEAEDVDACSNLYQKGFLIDYDPSLKCRSMVMKFNPVPLGRGRISWFIKCVLIHLGLY